MVALRMRWKKAKAGSLLSIIRDLSSPPCDFIHCSCAQCQIFRQDSETWQPGSCRAVVGCKCPWCLLYYDSTGHWDPKRAANAKLHCDVAGFDVSKVCDTLQPTSICSRTQSVMIGPTNRPAWHRQLEQYRQRRAAQAESRASLMEGRATTPKVVVMSPRKITTPVAQHHALVRRMPKQPTSQTPVVATTMAALVCASLAQGPAWDEARLLVDSGSEHPPLISTRMAAHLGLEGQVVSAVTQANGEILPLSDVGCLQLSINGLPVTQSFLSAPLSYYDIILGESWLRHHQGIMDYAHDQLWQLLPSGPVPLNFDI